MISRRILRDRRLRRARRRHDSETRPFGPFFVHVCFTAPHFPLQAKPEDIEKYKGRYDDGYFALRERRHRRQIELG